MMSPMGLSECFFWVVMPGLVPGIHVLVRSSRGVDGRDKPGHDRESRYAASTSTISESSSAVIFSLSSSRIAAPSRALTRTPLISTDPAAGTK